MGNKTKTMPVSFRGYGWRILRSANINDRLYDGAVRTFGYQRLNAGNLPRYKFVIRKGGNAFNPMQIIVTNGSFIPDLDHSVRKNATKNTPNGLINVIDEWGYVGVGDSLAPPVLFSHEGTAQPLVDACKMANRILHKKWTSRRRQVQGGVVLAELGKTLSMVIKPAKALRSKIPTLTSRLAKAKKRAGRGDSLVKVMADTWLETTFGWKPLVADIKDGAVAVARVATKDALERQQFRAYGDAYSTVQTSVGFQSVGCVTGATDLGFRFVDTTKRNGYCIIYGRWQTKLQDALGAQSSARRLVTLSGLNWEDIAPQVWELVPWSFLVDYFSNVGDVIESTGNVFDQPMWMVEVDIDETTRIRQYTLDQAYMKANYPGFIDYTGSDLTRTTSYKQIDRKAFNYDNLYPSLSFSLPINMQWLNIAALVAGGRSFQAFSNR
jgi:hypothetical protein